MVGDRPSHLILRYKKQGALQICWRAERGMKGWPARLARPAHATGESMLARLCAAAYQARIESPKPQVAAEHLNFADLRSIRPVRILPEDILFLAPILV